MRVLPGEMLLFLNPDTEITHNVFARMIAYLRGNVNAGALQEHACLTATVLYKRVVSRHIQRFTTNY